MYEHQIDSWYEGRNNWKECKLSMAAELGRINQQFSGNRIDRPVHVQPTEMQKAKDALFIEAGQPKSLEAWAWRNPVQSRLVTDYYWDHDFPPDNTFWYRGQGADCIEEFRQPVKWLRLSDLGGLGSPYVPALNEASQNPPPEKILQGTLEDFYLVQACYAVSTKSKLVRDIFADCDYSSYNKLGMYQLRFYKHTQWINVAVDDYLPFDKDDEPLCIRSECFPSFPWPSIVEKAYAKIHHSWEAISGGGNVEEVMTDLTGGASGRFHTTDVAGDRLWKYFQQLTRTTIWACAMNQRECGKRLIPIAKDYASAVYSVTQCNNVPYIGVFTSAPFASVKHFPMCSVPMPEGYDYTNGFMWLRVDDFAQLFDCVYECRLVNSDLNLIESVPRPMGQGEALEGSDRLPTPGYERDTPWFELIFAFDGGPNNDSINAHNCPSFLIDVPESATELILDAGQTCHRFSKHNVNPANFARHEQAPLLVRFFECSREMLFRTDDRPREANYMATAAVAGEIYMAHMSAWAHTRDSMCCVKVLRPGRFVAMVSMPSGYHFPRMTFRCYSSKQVGCRYLEAHKNMIAVNPGMPLSVIPYSITGIPRIDEYREHLPRMFDEEDGKGTPQGKRSQPSWQRRLMSEFGRYGNGDDEPRQKVIGSFGGPGGGGNSSAVETSSKTPCAFM